METIKLVATGQEQNTRLDYFVAAGTGLSRAQSQQLILDENILVNQKPVPKSYRLQAGDEICVTIPPPKESSIQAQNIPLDVVYEDASLLVVNKPKGMVVHPAPGNPDKTLVNALLYHCAGSLSGIGGEIRPGIVHRIDKDTSGLLVVAKNDEAHQKLAEQFAEHTITRVYHAVVYGGFKEDTGIIDKPIGRSVNDRKKMSVNCRHGKEAVTKYTVLERYNGFSHLALQLFTGRTHQIRVHMAQAGHPVAGDAVYGPRKVIKSLQGQCLHAKILGFVHPKTQEYMEFDSDLPKYFRDFLKSIDG